MDDQAASPSLSQGGEEPVPYFLHFGLIVTGHCEQKHLPKLFRSLTTTGICTFEVIRRVDQRSPIRSAQRRLRMVGTGQQIPDKDATDIGFPARRYLQESAGHFVLLIDDLEQDRREQASHVYERYRLALDSVLKDDLKQRAAVHFLVNMIEAYYLADAQAVNSVLDLYPPLEDYSGDVETIPNPKAMLRRRYPGFREVEHGGQILDLVDLEHVLDRPETCAWLRTLVAWCIRILMRCPSYDTTLSLDCQYQLVNGIVSSITHIQLSDG